MPKENKPSRLSRMNNKMDNILDWLFINMFDILYIFGASALLVLSTSFSGEQAFHIIFTVYVVKKFNSISLKIDKYIDKIDKDKE